MSTVDARRMELDAETGALCRQFGNGGAVDLTVGLGEVKPSFYMPTSAPTVIRGLIVVGGWVFHNIEVGEPTGSLLQLRKTAMVGRIDRQEFLSGKRGAAAPRINFVCPVSVECRRS